MAEENERKGGFRLSMGLVANGQGQVRQSPGPQLSGLVKHQFCRQMGWTTLEVPTCCRVGIMTQNTDQVPFVSSASKMQLQLVGKTALFRAQSMGKKLLEAMVGFWAGKY